jgi:cellulase
MTHQANIDAKGSCCNEMDIWEANAAATQLAPHTCNQTGLYECSGTECGADGVCDKNGCGQNPYALGNKGFYGDDMTVDTGRPFTVVTQFVSDSPSNATTKTLSQIRRLYVQDGKVIQNAAVNVTGQPSIDYVDDDYCSANGASKFESLGGVSGMGDALSRGMVLIFSIWWDTGSYMTWLDSGNAGPCNATEGNPTIIQQIQPDPAVTFSNIKWGEIGSTYGMKWGW